MKISISGTPGVGKTFLAKRLAKKMNYRLVELNKDIKTKKLYDSYDKKRRCFVVDVKKINKYFRKIKDKDLIVDSHLSHALSGLDKIFVLRCNPKILEKRLQKKRWNKEKIRENVEAEYISLISWEARQTNKNVYDIDNTGSKALNIIKQIINGKGKTHKKQINWM